MLGYIVGITCLVGAAILTDIAPCPPVLRLGQTYHEIQSGPCPDIDSVASFKAADSVHVGYLCRSQKAMVVGSIVTGRSDAIFLYEGN